MRIKTLLGLTCLLLVSMTIKANEILEEDKIWVLAYTDPFVDGEFSLFFCGDTIIENKTYHKSYWNYVAQDHFYGGLRAEADRIYYRSYDENLPELLLYDFNLNVNDTFNVYLDPSSSPIISKVVASKTMEFEFGEIRQIYYFDDGDKWIEGIGSIYGVVYYNAFSTLLKGYIENEVIVYCDPPFFTYGCEDFLDMHACNVVTATDEIEFSELSIFPNPTLNLLTVDLRATENVFGRNRLIVQDVNGVEVHSESLLNGGLQTIDVSSLTSGLYFISIKGVANLHCKFIKK